MTRTAAQLKALQETIAKNVCTAVAIAHDGSIKAVVPMGFAVPKFGELKNLTARYRGCVVQLFDQKNISLEELKIEVRKSTQAAQLVRTKKLKSGANLVDKEGRVEWAQDAARRRLTRGSSEELPGHL